VNGAATSLHKNKKGLWPPFPLFIRVHRIENFNRPRMKLVFSPPSNLKRYPLEGMIPKGNSKNICNMLVLYGVKLMKIYFLGN
jgi:hypothetical protein